MPAYSVTFSTTGWVRVTVKDAVDEADALRQAKGGADGEHVVFDDGEHLNVFDPEVELVDEGVNP